MAFITKQIGHYKPNAHKFQASKLLTVGHQYGICVMLRFLCLEF